MEYEYKTTHGDLALNGYEASSPKPPDGKGWEMCGMAASTSFLYWSWRRDISYKTWEEWEMKHLGI